MKSASLSKKNAPAFETVAIIGLGLIGGSIALEIKKRKLAKRIIGISRSATNRKEAHKQKVVDEAYPKISKKIEEADLVILAVPVGKIVLMLQELKKYLKPSTLVTDVGSTKFEIVEAAKKIKSFYFIGGHPIAGTEKSGMKAAMLGLFKNKKWILTSSSKTPPALLSKLKIIIQSMGAQIITMSPEQHDKIYAAVSHLPNILAYTLANTLFSQIKHLSNFAGSSLKDMTRLAESPPEMWANICLANRNEILNRIKLFETSLKKFKSSLLAGNKKSIFHFFEKGKKFRKIFFNF